MPLFLAAGALGVIVLVKAADNFVVGAARLATTWNVSPVVVGAVIIGFGTSVPEMFVSGLAAGQGDLDLGMGNIIGSNVANLSLVLGFAALLVPVDISSTTLRREAPLSVAACVLFAALAWDGLSRPDGLVLVVVLALALSYIIVDALRGSDVELVQEVAEYVDGTTAYTVRLELVRVALGLVGTLVGAQLVVYGARGVAEDLGLTEGFVGLTLVAIGTSLPELSTAIAAARKQEDELIVGNLLGSNIFNSLAVGATISLAGPGSLDDQTVIRLGIVVMVAVVGAAWLFMATGRRVARWEAGVLLGAYALTVPLIAA